MILHGRSRRQTSLLALDALDGEERRLAEEHAAGCASCRAELEGLRAALDLAAADPVRTMPPPVPLAALMTRVGARLDADASRRGTPWWIPTLAAVAAGALAVVMLRPMAPKAPTDPRPPLAVSPPAAGEVATAIPEDVLRRLENQLAREGAARYLADAEAVLVGVTSSPVVCQRRPHHVDLGQEAQRSRDILARRAALDLDAPAVAGARDVLSDVEGVLREVATLDPCTEPEELLAIREEIGKRRLLMKIDLMTRELLG